MTFNILQAFKIRDIDEYENICQLMNFSNKKNKSVVELKEEADLYLKHKYKNMFEKHNKEKKQTTAEYFINKQPFHINNNHNQKELFEVYSLFNQFKPKQVEPLISVIQNLFLFEWKNKPENFKSKTKSVENYTLELLKFLLFKYPLNNSLINTFKNKNEPINVLKGLFLLGNGTKFSNIEEFKRLGIQLTKKQLHFALTRSSVYSGMAHFRFAQIHHMKNKIIKAVMNNNVKTINFLEEEAFFQEFLIYINNQDLTLFDYSQIMPLYDFVLYEKRRNENDGKTYTIKHHTLFNLLSRMELWHKALGREKNKKITSWDASPMFSVQENVIIKINNNQEHIYVYRIQELLSSDELFKEGREMKHCVSSYSDACVKGRCRIFSLRESINGNNFKSKATIEVVRNKPVQIRGTCNSIVEKEYEHMINKYFS